MTRGISVLLVDDHVLFREMLDERLRSEGMDVSGLAGSGDEAIAFAEDTRPDVVVLDIDMPGTSAFKAARSLREVSPRSRVMFLSAFVQDRYVDQALSVEASGYLTKSDPLDVIIGAIRSVHSGATYFSPEVRSRIVIDPGGARLGNVARSRVTTLTDRELEILAYVAEGLSQKQIARLSRISVKTVQRHVTHIMEKLEIHDRVGLARFAIREGLIEA